MVYERLCLLMPTYSLPPPPPLRVYIRGIWHRATVVDHSWSVWHGITSTISSKLEKCHGIASEDDEICLSTCCVISNSLFDNSKCKQFPLNCVYELQRYYQHFLAILMKSNETIFVQKSLVWLKGRYQHFLINHTVTQSTEDVASACLTTASVN